MGWKINWASAPEGSPEPGRSAELPKNLLTRDTRFTPQSGPHIPGFGMGEGQRASGRACVGPGACRGKRVSGLACASPKHPQPPMRKPGSPHSKKLKPLVPHFQYQSTPLTVRKYRPEPSWEVQLDSAALPSPVACSPAQKSIAARNRISQHTRFPF
jgi:hypothetical protein